MRAIGQQADYASRFWEANVPFFYAIYRNTLLFLGFFGLSALYFAPAKFQYGPTPINVFIPSILVILGCMTLLGKRALVITSMDYFFAAWFALAFISQIFANEYLFRTLGFDSLLTNLEFILTLALTYRAFFALASVDLTLGTKAFIVSSLLTCGAVAALGVIQRFGPGKATALHIGMMLSKVPDQVQDGMMMQRPTGVYENPNMLGYMACIFAVFIIAWGLQDLKNLTPLKTLGMLFMLGLAIFTTLACQSRQNAALLVATPIPIGLLIRRYSRDSRNTAVMAVMVAIAMFGAVTFISLSKSDYLVSLTHEKISHDESFQARTYELNKVKGISADIAPLGTGESASNGTNTSVFGGYSYYRLPNVDSEWGNIYAGFGVWGPLLLVFFYILNGLLVRDMWTETSPEGRMMTYMGATLLIFNVILTITAVRVFKYDTGLFTFQILGVLAAWRTARFEKGLLKPARPATLSPSGQRLS